MKHIAKQTLEDLDDHDSSAVFEDIHFTECTFQSCSLSMALTPEKRSHVRRATLRDCKTRYCSIMNPVLEDVVIENLNSGNEPLFSWGALFSRVRIAGKIDKVKISSRANPAGFPDADSTAFDAARVEHYNDIEWALDIRDLRSQSFEIYDVPAELIILDPAHQAVVRREKALDEDRWQSLDLSDTWWPDILRQMIRQGHEYAALVTPLRNRHASTFIDGINTLRSAGMLES